MKRYRNVILDEMNYGGLPVAYWPLNEVSGTAAADEMTLARGTGYAGTLLPNSGGAWTGGTLGVQPGPVNRESGGWASFASASSNWVSATTMGTLGASLASGLAFEAMVKSSTTATIMCVSGILNTGTTQGFFIILNQTALGVTTAGAIRCFLGDNSATRKELAGSVNSNTGITDGNPHHLLVAFAPTTNTITVTLDGASQTVAYTKQETPNSWTNFTTPIAIGGRNVAGTAGLFYNGLMANAAVYNYVPTLDRAQAHSLARINGVNNPIGVAA